MTFAKGSARPQSDAVAQVTQGRVTSKQYRNTIAKKVRLKQR